MQLMSDALTVLGSRHGLFIEPGKHQAYVVRCGGFPGIPCELLAGLTVNGQTSWLPLSSAGDHFPFCDQDISPCTMKLTGIHPETALKLELTITAPFRPRDAAFSTAPVLDLELRVRRLSAHFRWTPNVAVKGDVTIQLGLRCEAFGEQTQRANALHWNFEADAYHDRSNAEPLFRVPQHDALVVHHGNLTDDGRIELRASSTDFEGMAIHASWCTWSEPMLRVHGELAPFKYTTRFADLDAVIDWVRSEPHALRDNAAKVDGILTAHNLSSATSHLAALTLHAWLINTWWCIGPDRDWFTVWEGDCYYHSTVDVEYTQSPFYLAVWPELLGLELDEWPDFVVPGDQIIGERAAGTVVFMHDIGQMSEVDTTRYNHPMPVEENTNYVLMSYAYWRRSGDDSRVRRHAGILAKALDFVLACDSSGNGVPDLGASNTIDDASPAVQFGKEQVYLAVKAMAAYETGAEMLRHADANADVAAYETAAAKIAAILHEQGWQQDHFVTLLDPSAAGVTNAWTGQTYESGQLPGWDAAHIYTANGLALLDMIGRSVQLDEARLAIDLRVATERCLDKYGCRHSDFEGEMPDSTVGEGGAIKSTCRIGWIAMNLLRDLSALYRGVDLRALMSRYWDFQVLVNTQGPHLFFETFNGNNLMTYPRGIAIWGYFDAIAGARIDRVAGTCTVAPFDNQVRVPLLLAADWQQGRVPLVEEGEVSDPHGLLGRLAEQP